MRLFKEFSKSTRANVAIVFGLAAIPVVMAGGMAVDYMGASKSQSALQQAVDDARHLQQEHLSLMDKLS